jgi:hypothetical protein
MNTDNKKEFNSSISSFKDCPNRCVDGYYVDPYKHKRVKCDYCAKMRKQLVNEQISVDSQSIEEILKLPFTLSDCENYDINVTIPEFSRNKMIAESVDKVSEILQGLINSVSVGDVSDYSMLFNLGSLCHEENFVYSYLTRAYIAGLSVSPYYSSHDIIQLRNKSESSVPNEDSNKFNELLDTDICVILVETGASYDALQASMGVVQLRAFKNKSTIIFTKVSPRSGKFNSFICDEENKCKNILTYYTVEFTEKVEEQERRYEEMMGSSRQHNNLKGMTSNGFSNLMSPRNSL